MAGNLSLSAILNALDTPSEEVKTASSTTDGLMDEVRQLLEETNVKTASEIGTNDLQKIAQEIVASQDQVMLNDAYMIGAAMRDGYETRGSAYGQAMEKTAAANAEATIAALYKFAEDNPELCKEAIAEGVRDAWLEKESAVEDRVSKSSFNRGYWDAQAVFEANGI